MAYISYRLCQLNISILASVNKIREMLQLRGHRSKSDQLTLKAKNKTRQYHFTELSSSLSLGFSSGTGHTKDDD